MGDMPNDPFTELQTGMAGLHELHLSLVDSGFTRITQSSCCRPSCTPPSSGGAPVSNAQKRAIIKARESVPGAPAPSEHAHGPRAKRRAFGFVNRTPVTLSEVLSVKDGKPVITLTPSIRAPKRQHVAAGAPGAKLVAHQRGAGFQHG